MNMATRSRIFETAGWKHCSSLRFSYPFWWPWPIFKFTWNFGLWIFLFEWESAKHLFFYCFLHLTFSLCKHSNPVNSHYGFVAWCVQFKGWNKHIPFQNNDLWVCYSLRTCGRYLASRRSTFTACYRYENKGYYQVSQSSMWGPNTQMVKKNTDLIWHCKTCANWQGKPLFWINKTTAKRW